MRCASFNASVINSLYNKNTKESDDHDANSLDDDGYCEKKGHSIASIYPCTCCHRTFYDGTNPQWFGRRHGGANVSIFWRAESLLYVVRLVYNGRPLQHRRRITHLSASRWLWRGDSRLTLWVLGVESQYMDTTESGLTTWTVSTLVSIYNGISLCQCRGHW